MELARKHTHTDLVVDDPESVPEHVLLLDTARALDEVQMILDRSRERAGRFEALRKRAVSDQEKLIAAQSHRIQGLERQLAEVHAFGDEQAVALDQAFALVLDLETRMGELERVNAELLASTTLTSPLGADPAPNEAKLGNDLDMIRVEGSGADLTRFNEFVRAHAA